MKCYKCNKIGKIKYQNGDLCGACFIEILTKRIKKEVRNESPFEKNQKVLVFGKLAREFLKKVVEGMPLKVTEVKELKNYSKINIKKYDKVVIPWTADDEANLFFSELTKNKGNYQKIGQNKKILKIFKPIMDKELKDAAKIIGIKYTPLKKDKFIGRIQEKYYNSTFGMNKAASEFKKAIK